MIRTAHLDLLPAAPETLHAALRGRAALARALGLHVPASWPPDLLDDDALRFTLERLAGAPEHAGWWMYFAAAHDVQPATLIGSGGFRGPPTDGTVEIGYSVVTDHRRHGYATDMVGGLVQYAFAHAGVHRVIADTLPSLFASIGVLARNGFRFLGPGTDPGTIRFVLGRAGDLRSTPGVPPSAAESTARRFIKHFTAGNMEGLAQLLTDDLRVDGPLLQTATRASYLAALARDPPAPAAARVHAVISDAASVFVAWEYVKPGRSVAIAQRFTLRGDRISHMLILFDPEERPAT